MLAHSETDRMYDGINEIARELGPAPEPEPQPQPEQKPEGDQSKPGTDGPLAQTGDPALLALVATGALGAGAVAAGCRAHKRSR